MQTYMRVCPICVKENHKIGKFSVPGWIDYFKSEDVIDADMTCFYHENQRLIKVSMTCEEFKILRQISLDPSFMQAMTVLKDKDIVEYTAKLSQFKSQLGEQKNSSSNQIKCPKCGSTNIQMVQRKWSLLTGFMTNKVDRVCVNCKYKF